MLGASFTSASAANIKRPHCFGTGKRQNLTHRGGSASRKNTPVALLGALDPISGTPGIGSRASGSAAGVFWGRSGGCPTLTGARTLA